MQEVPKEAVGNCLRAGRKHRLTLAHDGPGRQTRGCYGAVATAFGDRENALCQLRGWIRLLGSACARTWRRMGVNCIKRRRVQSIDTTITPWRWGGWFFAFVASTMWSVDGSLLLYQKDSAVHGNGCFPSLRLLLKESSS